jgi:hypothetical protein
MVAIAFPPEVRLSPMCFSNYNSWLRAAQRLGARVGPVVIQDQDGSRLIKRPCGGAATRLAADIDLIFS